MGRALAKLRAVPDAIIASPASRAKQTAAAAAQAMGWGGTIRLERALYDAGGDAWLAALRAMTGTHGSALVVAHSPGIAEAAALLCGSLPDAFDVPTAGLIALDADLARWRDLDHGGASLRWFLRPKLVEQLS